MVKTFLRILLAATLALAAIDAASQSTARPKPPGTVPLEDIPPPPRDMGDYKDPKEPAIEPQVTTRTEGEQTVQEYRVRGKLYMVRITPKNGRPYVLMDHKGDGSFTRQDNTLDQGVRVPQWVLLEF